MSLVETQAPVASSAAVFQRLQNLWAGGKAHETATNPIAETLPVLDALSASGFPCYLLMDMRTQQYLYASPSQQQMSGVPSEALYKGGLGYVFERIHPNDRQPLVAMFEAKWAFFKELSEDERPHFRANYDYRLLNAGGQYRRIQQQSLCLRATAEGLPHVILAQLVDITHLKDIEPEPGSDKPNLLLTVHTGGADRLVMRCGPTGNQLQHKPLLTQREHEVLSFLEKGLSSRAIAEKLGTSPHTVETQRRQMIAKTGVVDTTALVSYAHLLGWLAP